MDEWCEQFQACLASSSANGTHKKRKVDEGSRVVEASKQIRQVADEMRGDLVGKSGISEKEANIQVRMTMQLALRKQMVDRKLDDAGFLVDVAVELSEDSDVASAELPFLLLEDLFEVETVDMFEKVWEILEQRVDILTSAKFMPTTGTTLSKMAVLRIANFVLRRLSALHHTVLCGRVMMFLAFAFPLTDRSGVNLLGAYNDLNTTEFEDSESFAKAQDSTSHESESNVDSSQVVNYVLYETFWELQRFLQSKPNASPSGCASSVPQWNRFVQASNVVLSAFESKPFSKADLEREVEQSRQKKRRRASMETDEEDSVARIKAKEARFFPTKYLSSSRLLKLQLSDPTLRRNVLVQFCILFHSLTSSPQIELSPEMQALIHGKQKKTLDTLRKRVIKLLRATPPDGHTFADHLDYMLKRESKWLDWKAAKCPSFERYEEEKEPEDDTVSKRRLAQERNNASRNSKMATRVKETRLLWQSNLQNWSDDLSKSSEDLVPDFSKFISLMKAALDPDSGIEEEYHPKHDHPYCWRGLRLLSRSDLSVMQQVSDGSLENAVKIKYNIVDEEPPASDSVNPKVEEEDTMEVDDPQSKEENKDDSSPQDETEAKEDTAETSNDSTLQNSNQAD